MSPRPRGRPKGEEGGTKHLRMYDDVVKMVTWIVRIRGGTSASYLDPILRARVTEDYLKLLTSIQAIKAAEDAARVEGGQSPTEPLPVVIPLSKSTTFEDIQAEVAQIDAANAANRAGQTKPAEPPVEPKKKPKK
jgi:hypothetical protein